LSAHQLAKSLSVEKSSSASPNSSNCSNDMEKTAGAALHPTRLLFS
jgi:hypothetical protein